MSFIFQDWDLIDYEVAWKQQKELVQRVKEQPDENYLVLCQHPSVITIGRNGSENNVTTQQFILEQMGIKTIQVDRGGDVTLHNPGQIVGYPVFNLNNYKTDLHWFLREIEECIIEICAVYGISAGRYSGYTGVWIDEKRKICAIGMHCSNWVTSHGFALNVNNNLTEFEHIVPCGISNKKVCSIESEIGTVVDYNKVKIDCLNVFKEHF